MSSIKLGFVHGQNPSKIVEKQWANEGKKHDTGVSLGWVQYRILIPTNIGFKDLSRNVQNCRVKTTPRSSLPHHFADARPASAEWIEPVWSCLYLILDEGNNPTANRIWAVKRNGVMTGNWKVTGVRSWMGWDLQDQLPKRALRESQDMPSCFWSPQRPQNSSGSRPTSPMEVLEGGSESQFSTKQSVLLWLLASLPPCLADWCKMTQHDDNVPAD